MTLKGTDKTGWRVCLSYMGLSLLAAAVATYVFAYGTILKARKAERARQQGGDPLRDAADIA